MNSINFLFSHAAQVIRAILFTMLILPMLAQASFAGVYDNQPPFSRRELSEFIELLPQFRAWSKTEREDPHPQINGKGQADFIFSPKASAWVKGKGWEPQRFFCVMGRAAAALYIVAEGNDLKSNYPKDMPKVSAEELKLVRDDLPRLLRAGGDASPPPPPTKK